MDNSIVNHIVENSEFRSGHKALKILYQRCYSLALEWVSKFAQFDKLIKDYWDKRQQEYSVKYYYDLPEQVRDKGEIYLGKELKKLWNEAQVLALDRNNNKLYLAIKLCCFNDYGFLKEK